MKIRPIQLQADGHERRREVLVLTSGHRFRRDVPRDRMDREALRTRAGRDIDERFDPIHGLRRVQCEPGKRHGVNRAIVFHGYRLVVHVVVGMTVFRVGLPRCFPGVPQRQLSEVELLGFAGVHE